MKTLFTFLLTVGSLTSVLAQDRYDNDKPDDRYNRRTEAVAANNRQRPADRTTVYNQPSPAQRDREERARQQEVDRINRDYDRRVDDYRKDRSLSPYERDRRIAQAEQERKEKTNSFIKGAVAGGIAGVLLGVLISH